MRAYNFCAGPAAIPEPVLQKAQNELSEWGDVGSSIMEISHRSKTFTEVALRAEQALRQLLDINDDYAVLFMQGGASLQFAGVPMNLLANRADYLQTGAWSKKAYQEANRYTMLGTTQLVASGEDSHYTDVPCRSTWQLSERADYFHYCSNETIHGVYTDIPKDVSSPLVCDMSSDILSRPIDVSRFGLIYAGAQKNIGPAGLSVVIVQKQLLGRANGICPSVMNYTLQADNGSMVNTPPTFAWYLSGLVFEWLIGEGGVAAIYEQNKAKARLLYQTIDNSSLYHNRVAPACRSIMNVPFTLADDALDTLFLQKAAERGLLNLKGHRLVGGMRASLYNAMPLAGVVALTDFMQDFEKTHA